MIIERDYRPYPSDFADYVYCARGWAFKKHSKERLTGVDKNEDKCINWVLNKYNISEKQIVFNGTGKNNCNFLTSEIESVDTNMRCKPDLIISQKKRHLLYEFKSVRNPSNLGLPVFDSVYAQVWCYTKIKEIEVDEYRLLRYHIDPSIFSYYYFSHSDRKLTPCELDSHRFERLFANYIEAIELLSKPRDPQKKTGNVLSTLFNPPQEKRDLKCCNCRNWIKNICNQLND